MPDRKRESRASRPKKGGKKKSGHQWLAPRGHKGKMPEVSESWRGEGRWETVGRERSLLFAPKTLRE